MSSLDGNSEEGDPKDCNDKVAPVLNISNKTTAHLQVIDSFCTEYYHPDHLLEWQEGEIEEVQFLSNIPNHQFFF
jgi:hypothetical protein